MKKILIAILVIAVVAAIAIGGTVAYWSTDSTPGVAEFTFGTAGLTNDIAIDAQGIYPGWSHQYTVHVHNSGDVDLWVTPGIDTSGASAIDSYLAYHVDSITGASAVAPYAATTAQPSGSYFLAKGATATVVVTVSVPTSVTGGQGAYGYYYLTFHGDQANAH